jgi:ABC-type sugar transport system ATPase subunit
VTEDAGRRRTGDGARPADESALAEPALRAESVVIGQTSPAVDFELPRGVIVGLAGLEGNGQEAFLEVLAGWRRPRSGKVVVTGRTGQLHTISNPHDAVLAGVCYLPRDRKREGIFPSMSILDNFAVACLPEHARLGVVRRREISSSFEAVRRRLGIVAGSKDSLITTLSGGNQQKVLLGRILALKPSVLVLNDPTRGVDANSKVSFYRIFSSLAEEDGVSIVILSTELTELVELCSQVLVFHHAALVRSCQGDTLRESSILAGMFGESDVGSDRQ